MSSPLVSVCMITYNHESFIAQAIEGVMMQKSNFDYQLVIGDDYSTDKTRIICEKYANKYNDKIILLHSSENIGMMPNFIKTLQACTGKYIALCEGDDYWIDPLKLQKQVDLLENTDTIVGSYTDTYIKTKNNQQLKLWRDQLPKIMNLTDIIAKYSPFHTSSFLFRRDLLKDFPDWLASVQSGDMFLFAYVALHGKLVKAETTPTVYRKHERGITNSSIHNNQGFHIGRLFLWINFKKEYNLKLTKIDDVIHFHASSILNSNMSILDIKLLLKQLGLIQLISSFGLFLILKSAIKKILIK